MSETQVRVVFLAHVNDTHSYQFGFLAETLDSSISHNVGARVYTHYYAFCLYHCSLSVKIGIGS